MKLVAIVFICIFIICSLIAYMSKKKSIYENNKTEKNNLEGKKVVFVENSSDSENADGVHGHLEAVGNDEYAHNFYEKYWKRLLDVVLSFLGMLILSPLYIGLSIAIYIDDPGPVFFTQKRVGRGKQYFQLHKFRSMKMVTPHDVPTHMLENPEQYITRVGKFIRLHSLDELPQIWDIFIGNMSIIGPRPALWNQDVLIAERDKYHANDMKPGLTGWAQINGRDELEIKKKAELDGEYVEVLSQGGWKAFMKDLSCFLGTISKVGRDDTVVEGGTGEIRKRGIEERHQYTEGKNLKEIIGNLGFGEKIYLDKNKVVKILITGENSYIGNSFIDYARKHYTNNFNIDVASTLQGRWKEKDFGSYDVVFHVAGIAHADVGHASKEIQESYYEINTELAIEIAKYAKAAGVKEFVYMSSMIVYGDSAGYGKNKVITSQCVPQPQNFYGDSKLQADVGVRSLADSTFKVLVMRPPMIYGKNSKGNYPTLSKIARKIPIFPEICNQRSMLYIDNFSEFLCQVLLINDFKRESVVLTPQNAEWSQTSDLVRLISERHGRHVLFTKVFNPFIRLFSHFPGKIGDIIKKVFGNNCYAQELSYYDGIDYQINTLKDSIEKTEG